MAELAFQDRLQPALLDRLSDNGRTVIVVELSISQSRLEEHGVSIEALELAVRPLGLRPWRQDAAVAARGTDDALTLQFVGPADGGTLARARAVPVATNAEPLPLGRLAVVASRTATNRSLEPGAQRVVSMRQLRESVLRDLGWLLSTTSMDSDRSLAAWPEVERSVVNFGLPTVAGRQFSGFDSAAAAARLKKAIETFEPRLTRVSVAPEVDSDRMDQRAIVFRVEAELWGQPMPQRLMLRTQIDVDSSHVVITDAESG